MAHSDPNCVTRRGLLLLALAGCLPAIAGRADAAPRFLAQWGQHGKGEGEFDAPIAIAVSADDRIFVTDFKSQRVQQFLPDGRFVSAFAVQSQPGGLAVDGEGLVYVAHWNLHKVAVYTRAGQLVREWGKQGAGDGEFRLPGGMAVGKDSSLYVADQGNGRIQKFSREGQFLLKWGGHGDGPGLFGGDRAPGSRFAGPQFVALDRAGNVYATDTVMCRVQKFTAEGKHLRTWGSRDAAPGGFGGGNQPITGPIALCVDRQDRVWVGATNHRVQQFDGTGRVRAVLEGAGGERGPFHVPHGLVVDRRGHLYVVDTGNARVVKFDPGR